LEVVNLAAKVGPLVFVREIVSNNHWNTTMLPAGFHQIEHVFLCGVADDDVESTIGTEPDTPQTSVAWLTIDDLSRERFFFRVVVSYLVKKLWQRGFDEFEEAAGTGGAIYLGDAD